MGQGRFNGCNDSVSECTITIWWERDVASEPERDPCDEEWKWGEPGCCQRLQMSRGWGDVYGFKGCGREKLCMGISIRVGKGGRVETCS